MLESIHDLLLRHPFVPFQIVLTSGDKYPVDNPQMLVVQESQLFYAYPKSDRFAFIRNNQIAAVESIQKAA